MGLDNKNYSAIVNVMSNRYTRSINETKAYNGAGLCDLMLNEGTFEDCRSLTINEKGIVRLFYYDHVKPADNVCTGKNVIDFVDRFCKILDDGDWIYEIRTRDTGWVVGLSGRKGVDKKYFTGFKQDLFQKDAVAI